MPCMQLWLSNEFGASFPVSFSLKTGGNYMQRDKDPKNKDPAPPIVFFLISIFYLVSLQGCTETTMHRVKRKRRIKHEKHTGKLIRKK